MSELMDNRINIHQNNINMSIYDTFGSLIYYENNIDLQGWDGTLGWEKAENGNYLIVVKATTIFAW